MNRHIPLILFLVIMIFLMLTAHHNKAAEPSTNLSENSVIKKYHVCIGISLGRICIGIDITGKEEGVGYVCDFSQKYCAATVDEADIQFAPQNGHYFVNVEDIIDINLGTYQEL